MRAHFRPEFLNRIDEKIIFNRLRPEDTARIVDIQINILKNRLKERDIGLELDPKARALLVERGYDPLYGARPLKRVVQRLVQDMLAMMILNGEVQDKDQIKITVGKNGALEMQVIPEK